MVMSLNDTLLGINYFNTFIGAGIALLVPQTVISNCGPAYYRDLFYPYSDCISCALFRMGAFRKDIPKEKKDVKMGCQI